MFDWGADKQAKISSKCAVCGPILADKQKKKCPHFPLSSKGAVWLLLFFLADKQNWKGPHFQVRVMCLATFWAEQWKKKSLTFK